MRYHSKLIDRRLNDKYAELSEREDRPLQNGSHDKVVTLDGVRTPKFVRDVLLLGPKNQIIDKLNDVQFHADVDRLVCELS